MDPTCPADPDQPDLPVLDDVVALRLRLAGATTDHGRPFDPVELAAWLLTGDFDSRTMPGEVSLGLRLDALLFVAAALGADGHLGTVADPIAAAAQLAAWIKSDTIGPVPRHFKVSLVPADQVNTRGEIVGYPHEQVVRVLREPDGRFVTIRPADAL